MRKAQVTMEFMILLGFILIISIPLMIIYHGYSTDTQNTLAENQAMQIGNKIVDNAESVYYLGPPSKTTIKVSMPNSIKEINITSREIVFKINYKGMIREIVIPSSVNLTGNISSSSGVKFISIEAIIENKVLIDG